MKLRNKDGALCSAGTFNTSALDEIIVYFVEEECGFFDCSSDFIRNYDVWIEALGEWKDLGQAFSDQDVITNNYNTRFHEPENDEERERGWSE